MTDERPEREAEGQAAEDMATEASPGPAGPRLPKTIGQFHIKKVLAWGGMGVVYQAVQEQPRRTVALKLMRHGIASRSAMGK